MFLIDVKKVIAGVTQVEDMTSGSQNVYVAQFNFSDEWQYLDRTAVFRAGETVINVVLGEDNRCMVPWEVMVDPYVEVEVGAFGTRNGNIVMPTIWASMGNMLQGVITGILGMEPTPSVYEQLLFNYNKLVAALDAGELKGDTGPAGPAGPQGPPGESGVNWTVGHGLKLTGDELSVDMANDTNPDRTLPVSAAAMDTTVGNIEILLRAIRGG